MSQKWSQKDIPDLSGKITIVTGANSGIGYETAKALSAKGATVVMACRNLDKARAAVTSIQSEVPDAKLDIIQLDLADLASVKAFADSFQTKYEKLDILINNAGVMIPPYTKTKDGFEVQFGANHLGHFALTGQLMDVIAKAAKTSSARVVNVSSIAHRSGTIYFEDLNFEQAYKPWEAYGQSKLANLLFTRNLNKHFQAKNIDAIATSAHPGWTSTNLQENSGMFKFLNPLLAQKMPMGALPTLYAAVEDLNPNDFAGPSGWQEMRGHPKLVDMVDAAKDEAVAQRLWDASEELTGINYT